MPDIGPPPRTVRVRRSALAAIVGLPLVLLAFAGLMLRGNNQALARLQGIIDNGQETTAEVGGRRTRGLKSKTYFVSARYRVDRQEYSGEFESKALYDGARQGQSITVSYAVANPSIAELGTREEVAAKREQGLSSRWVKPGLMVVPGLVTLVVFGYRVRQQLALVRDGTLRWGTVTHVELVKKHARVTIRVEDSLGTVTRTCGASSDFARRQPVDSRAAVLSPPDDPSRFTLCETAMSGVVVESGT